MRENRAESLRHSYDFLNDDDDAAATTTELRLATDGSNKGYVSSSLGQRISAFVIFVVELNFNSKCRGFFLIQNPKC